MNMADATAGQIARKPPSSQGVEAVRAGRLITLIQYRRIVARLKARSPLYAIARDEGVSMDQLRHIIALAVEEPEKQMAAVGMHFGNFAEGMKRTHREIEEGIIEELRQGAA